MRCACGGKWHFPQIRKEVFPADFRRKGPQIPAEIHVFLKSAEICEIFLRESAGNTSLRMNLRETF
jgi:hypothetical protein